MVAPPKYHKVPSLVPEGTALSCELKECLPASPPAEACLLPRKSSWSCREAQSITTATAASQCRISQFEPEETNDLTLALDPEGQFGSCANPEPGEQELERKELT